jgi:hypothetical protein
LKIFQSFFESLPGAVVEITVFVVRTSFVVAAVVDFTVVLSTVCVVGPRVVIAVVWTVVVAGVKTKT